MKTLSLVLTLALALPTAFADATLQEKTQVHFSGAIGSIINVFGRSATHEGTISDVSIHKNRKLSRSGDTGELVDLDQEKIYYINYARKTYKVKTFDELRREYEDSKKRAEERETKSTAKREDQNAPEYEVEFAVKPTGNKDTINGWPTREEIVTVTVHEKGKTLEDAGGFVLTDDAWIGPHIAAKRELIDFEQRYMKKLYGDAFMANMQQAMVAMAGTPAFAKAMKTFNSKQGALDGTPIRSKMTFETVTGKNQTADQQQQQPASLGGLLGRMRKRNNQESGPQRNSLFESNNELLKATTSASASDVAVPADFRIEK